MKRVGWSLLAGVLALNLARAEKAQPNNHETRAVAAEAPAFDIQCKRADDKLTVVQEGAATVFVVTSPRGIGSATLTRRGTAWPARMLLRLKLTGLESLTVTAGPLTLSASVQSHGKFTKQVQWTPDHVALLDPGLLQAFTADGKPTDKLPGKDGWFELVIPSGLFERASQLEIQWVDFYR